MIDEIIDGLGVVMEPAGIGAAAVNVAAKELHQLLIERHGDDAPIHAAMEADAMMDKGNLDGCAVWKRLLKAVEELLAVARPVDQSVH